jgi:RNA recognition motif-containing protein
MMNKRLFVAGLPFTTTQDELRDLFAGVGTVVSVTIINDRDTGKSKGFGFVEMDTPEEADAAKNKFNDSDFGGRKLVVADARPMEERNDRPARSGGFGKRDDFGRREGGRGNFGRNGNDGHRPGRGSFSR